MQEEAAFYYSLLLLANVVRFLRFSALYCYRQNLSLEYDCSWRSFPEKGRFRMNGETMGFSAALEHALEQLAERKGNEYSSKIGGIVRANIKSGRVQHFLERETVPSISAYVECVADHYALCHHLVYQLQEEQDPLAWKELLAKLRQWAYAQLWHRSFLAERRRHAADCANDAAVAIATSGFPYDTSFSSWARIIVRNTCLSYIQARCRARIVPDGALVDADHKEEWLQTIPDPRVEETRRNVELRQALQQAMEQLTMIQRRFIILYYFKGLDYVEVAALTQKSKNTLYKLHHDALVSLRNSWDLTEK